MQKILNKKDLSGILSLCLACFLLGAMFVYGQTVSQTHIISGGIYPGAPSYTVWTDGVGNFYAKNAYGVLSYSGTDASAVLNNVLAAGATVLVAPGTYPITSMVMINYSGIQLKGSGYTTVLSMGVNSTAIVQALNVWNIAIENLKFDGNWGTGIVGLLLDGVIYSHFSNMWFDECYTSIQVLADGSATQNSGYNLFEHTIIENTRYGITFDGTLATRYVTLNTFVDTRIGGLYTLASGLITFIKAADNNIFYDTYLDIACDGSVGVTYNSASPTTDQEVYENHFNRLCVTGYGAGTLYAIHANRCSDYRVSYVELRTAGTNTPYVDLEADSYVRLENSGINDRPISNFGNVTSVTNGQWIAHGIAYYPTYVLLTPTTNVTVWVASRNSTHFQVGVSSGTTGLYWEARYNPDPL